MSVFTALNESVPGPLRDLQTVRHILSRVVVAIHRRRGGPRKVIVKHASDLLISGEAGIFKCLIKTSDRPLVHLFVRPVAAVNPHYRSFVAVLVLDRRWTAE